jgi:GT2 family glycosyltransferase
MTRDREKTARVHVLLPVHNRRACTERFVRGLAAQSHCNWHLVLIDDGSTDGTGEMVREIVPSVTILRGNGHWWWGGALQQGFQWLRQHVADPDDVVLIINDDTVISPDFLAAGVGALRPRSLLLARLHDLATGAFVELGVFWDWRRLTCCPVRETGEPINCFSTRGLFVRLGDFMEIGGFHPLMLPHYLSDYEFTMRAQRKGFGLFTDPGVRLTCDQDATGLHTVSQPSLAQRVRGVFSLKSAMNPVYMTNFIILTCPARYMLPNIARVWWRLLRLLGSPRQMVSS